MDDSFTKVSESALLNVPGPAAAPPRSARIGAGLLRRVPRRGGDDPSILADLAATQVRVGQILSDLSEQDKARVALRRAVELYDKALAARPGDVALLERQSEVWHRLGDLDYRTDKPTANTAYRKAIAIRERLAADHPAEPRFRMAFSRSFNGVALTASPTTSSSDAYRRSLELRLKLADEIPEDPDLLHGLSESFLNLGSRSGEAGIGKRRSSWSSMRSSTAAPAWRVRPHDLEFALDLAISYSEAATFLLAARPPRRGPGDLGRGRGIRAASSRPTIPKFAAYRDCAGELLGRTRQVSQRTWAGPRRPCRLVGRRPRPWRRSRTRTPAPWRPPRSIGLASPRCWRDGSAAQDFKSWPEAARREADLAIADLKGAVARGFRGATSSARIPNAKALLSRDDMKALLAEMERPSGGSASRIDEGSGRCRAACPRRWTSRAGSRKTGSWAS